MVQLQGTDKSIPDVPTLFHSFLTSLLSIFLSIYFAPNSLPLPSLSLLLLLLGSSQKMIYNLYFSHIKQP